jgi:hypothetical protein
VRRETAEHGVAAQAAILELARAGEQDRCERRRRPHLEVQAERRALKPRGRDADDRQQTIVHANITSDRRRITIEMRPPVVVRDDDDGRATGLGDFVRANESSGGRREPERREIVSRDEERKCTLDPSALAHGERHHPERDEVGEAVQPLAQVAVLAPRDAGIRPGFRARLDEVQRSRIRNAGQRTQHDGLHPREHSGVHADADAERCDDDEGDDRDGAERAPGVSKVCEHQPGLIG